MRSKIRLHRPGAFEDAIAAAEARLGAGLPDDYRAFLRASNGFDHLAGFPTSIADFDFVEEILWFRDDRHRRLDRVMRELAFDQDGRTVDASRFREALLVASGDGNECLFLVPNGTTDAWDLWRYHRELPLRCFFSMRALFSDIV